MAEPLQPCPRCGRMTDAKQVICAACRTPATSTAARRRTRRIAALASAGVFLAVAVGVLAVVLVRNLRPTKPNRQVYQGTPTRPATRPVTPRPAANPSRLSPPVPSAPRPLGGQSPAPFGGAT